MKKILSLGLVAVLSLGLIFTNTATVDAAVAQRGTATSASTSGSTLTINKPAGVVSGDVLIANIAHVGSTVDTTAPSGWVLISRVDQTSGTDSEFSLWYKIAGASEGASYDFAVSSDRENVGAIIAFSGVDTTGGVKADGTAGGPFEVDPGNISIDDGSLTVTGLSTVNANAAIVMFAMGNDDNSFASWNTTSPGVLTELYDAAVNGNDITGSDGVVAAAWAVKASAGATGNGTATMSASDNSGGLLVALRPFVAPPADTTAPTVTIDSTSPNPTNVGTTLAWHANENGAYSVRKGSTTCANGTVLASGTYSTQPATVGTVISAANLDAGNNDLRVCVTDTATPTANTGSNTISVTKDTTVPTVTLSSTASSVVGGPFPVTATFSEVVTGLTSGEISVGNGTVGGFSGGGTTYNFTVTPTAAGLVTVNLPANVAQDAATNNNTAATGLSYTFNTTAFNIGLVSLTFDDGYKSQFDNRSELNSYKGTFYVNSVTMFGAAICGGAPNCYNDYMPTADVQTLFGAGHEIAAHSRSHFDLTTLPTLEELLFEIDGNRLDLLGVGVNVKVSSLAFPFGVSDDEVIAKLQSAGFTGGRGVSPDELNSKNTNPYALFSRQINANTTLLEIQSWIDEAAATNKWLILVVHQVDAACDSVTGLGGDIYCATPTTLGAIADYLATKESVLDVVTISQGLGAMNGAPITDGIAPVITQPNLTVFATSTLGASVVFPVSVTDNDSNFPYQLNAFCTVPNSVQDPVSGLTYPTAVASGHVFPMGTTTVTCTSADTGGNLATLSFDVGVVDGGPVISGTPANFSVEATSAAGAVVTYTLPTAADVTDGPVAVTCDVLSGATLPLGPTVVTCTATDTALHSSQTTFTVTVVDTTPPAITLNGSAVQSVVLGSVFVDEGVTVSDLVSLPGAIVVASTTTQGGVGVAGVNTSATTTVPFIITYTATDAAGNATTSSRTVNITDLVLSAEDDVAATTDSVTITWTTTHPATSRVLYDTVSHDPVTDVAPNYGYANSTVEDATLVTNHSVVISGLSAGTTYYFRPVSHGSPEVLGAEVSVTTTTPPPSPTPAPTQSNGGGGGGGGMAFGSSPTAPGWVNNSTGGAVSGGSTIAQAPQTTGEVLGESVFIFTQTLSIGSTGNEVTELQKRLTAEGVYTGPITGYFGALTKAGVMAYQAKYNLEQVGIVGPKTRAKLNGGATGEVLGASTTSTGTFIFTQTLSIGSTGNEVTELQKRLTAEGVYTGPITGYFGALTKAGVMAYQAKYNLEQVGIVGPKTRAKLNGGVEGSTDKI